LEKRRRNKWQRRDKKRNKRYGMKISGRSVFTLDEIIQEKARKIRDARKKRDRR
jgi:hypothetical protein